jgi:hypothetical protein
MTALKKEAVELIDRIADSEMVEVVALLKNFEIRKNEQKDIQEGLEGLKILNSFVGTLPQDFDYDKELEEALEEKYGYTD